MKPPKKSGNYLVMLEHVYKPGDMPPEGYIARQEWAKVQYKAGLRQTRDKDGKWQFPQQIKEKK